MQEHRLAAIMFTDIVGYTALMGEDEDRAFETLRINKEIHIRLIDKYRGTLIKEMGDGILVSFNSSSDAVRCAFEIQKESKEKEIPLKIGIHEGEMVFEGDDVLGDGVNIASRLEAVTETGNITISEAIYRNVKNKPGIYTAFLDEKLLKNVDDPVKTYQVSDQEITIDVNKSEKTSKPHWRKVIYALIAVGVILIAALILWKFFPSNQLNQPAGKDSLDKSIAVLPFKNDSSDPDNEYLCNGMMEDILTNLQKIGELEVKSRTDVEQYRETTKTVAIIGSELQVAFIIEGSVRKIGDDLRITAQLIDVNTGDHVWADMYDGKYTEEIFDFQSNIARKVANALHASITPKEEEHIEKTPTTNITAYDLCKRASNEINRHWLREGDEFTLKLARKLIDGALEIDPKYIQALSLKGRLCIAEHQTDSLYFYASRILKIDPEASEGYFLMGRHHEFKDEIDETIDNYQLAIKYLKPEAEDIHLIRAQLEVSLGQLYFRHKHDVLKALSHYQKAFDFNTDPDFMPYGNLAFIFSIIGDYIRAEMYGKKLIEMAPKLDGWYILLQGPNLQRQGKYNQSINFLDSMSAISIRNHPITYGLCLNHLLLGNLDQAEQYYNQWLNLGGGTPLQNAEDFAYLYKKLGKDQEAINMLNEGRAKWEEIPKNDRYAGTLASLSTIYALLDKKEESLKYLSQAVEKGKGCSYWRIDFETDPRFENLWDDPEFKAIMKRLKDKKQALQEEVRKMRERGEISF